MNPFTAQVLAADQGREDGRLLLGGVPAEELVRRYGSPLYVHDLDLAARELRRLVRALPPGTGILYSVKANPLLALVQHLGALGCGAETASLGELEAALACGISPERIFFAGPGKSRAEHLAAVRAGIGAVHLESWAEAERLAGISGRGRIQVGLRVNPVCPPAGAGMRMGGGPQPFGVDEEELAGTAARLAGLENLELRGLQAYTGTQVADAAWLLELWEHLFDLAAGLAAARGGPLDYLDLGGGFAVPHHEREKELDLDALARGLAPLWERHRGRTVRRLLVEPGRFLVARGGTWLCRVVEVKRSRGRRYLVVDGGMNHNALAAGTMGQVFRRDLPLVAAGRLDREVAGEPCRVVGPLCTPLDELAREALLPPVAPGDVLAFLRCGAYAWSAAHLAFLSRPTPAEVVLHRGQSRLARAAGAPDQWRAGQQLPELPPPGGAEVAW